jgi:hypothetical protein
MRLMPYCFAGALAVSMLFMGTGIVGPAFAQYVKGPDRAGPPGLERPCAQRPRCRTGYRTFCVQKGPNARCCYAWRECEAILR